MNFKELLLSFCSLVLVVTLFMGNFTEAREGSSTRDATRASKPTSNTVRSRQPHQSLSKNSKTRRLREGTVVNDLTGYFREDGDGASFIADTGMEFGALQNLNLERVVRLLKNTDEPSSIRWSVTGTVTEFSGRNYLLISRAVYKSASPPPAPDRVAP